MQETQETQYKSLDQEDPLKGKWLPTPVFLPGKFHKQRSLAGYSPWGHKESDATGHARDIIVLILRNFLLIPRNKNVFLKKKILVLISNAFYQSALRQSWKDNSF